METAKVPSEETELEAQRVTRFAHACAGRMTGLRLVLDGLTGQ